MRNLILKYTSRIQRRNRTGELPIGGQMLFHRANLDPVLGRRLHQRKQYSKNKAEGLILESCAEFWMCNV